MKSIALIAVTLCLFIGTSSLYAEEYTKESQEAYMACMTAAEEKCEKYQTSKDCAGICGRGCWEKHREHKDRQKLIDCMNKCWSRCNDPQALIKCWNRKSKKCARLLVVVEGS